MLANVASNYLIGGGKGGRFGNGHPNIVPYTAYPAKDGMIAVAVGNDAQFARFAAVLGHPEWAQRSALRDQPGPRRQPRHAIDGLIETALVGRDRRSLDRRAPRRRASRAAASTRVAEALETEQPRPAAWSRPSITRRSARSALLGAPFKFSETPTSVRRHPPTHGEHTAEILADGFGKAS